MKNLVIIFTFCVFAASVHADWSRDSFRTAPARTLRVEMGGIAKESVELVKQSESRLFIAVYLDKRLLRKTRIPAAMFHTLADDFHGIFHEQKRRAPLTLYCERGLNVSVRTPDRNGTKDPLCFDWLDRQGDGAAVGTAP